MAFGALSLEGSIYGKRYQQCVSVISRHPDGKAWWRLSSSGRLRGGRRTQPLGLSPSGLQSGPLCWTLLPSVCCTPHPPTPRCTASGLSGRQMLWTHFYEISILSSLCYWQAGVRNINIFSLFKPLFYYLRFISSFRFKLIKNLWKCEMFFSW